jgi:hypothetical protein
MKYTTSRPHSRKWKGRLTKFNRIKVMQGILIAHNGIKLEMINKKKFGKFFKMWKLNNALLKTSRSKKRSPKKIL